jgi:hypothetical protein
MVGLALAFSPRLFLRLTWLWVGLVGGWCVHALLMPRRLDLPALLELQASRTSPEEGGRARPQSASAVHAVGRLLVRPVPLCALLVLPPV